MAARKGDGNEKAAAQGGEARTHRHRRQQALCSPQQAGHILQRGRGRWPVSDSGPTPQGQERSEARPRGPGGSAPVTPKVRREPTVKAPWGDLLARVPEPHVVVAVLPGSSENEGIINDQSAQRLMVRLIRKLRTRGEFAVTVSRQTGQREILCAFGDSSAAALVANAASASVSGRARYSFVLDEPAERKLVEIAGPGEPHRPRASM